MVAGEAAQAAQLAPAPSENVPDAQRTQPVELAPERPAVSEPGGQNVHAAARAPEYEFGAQAAHEVAPTKYVPASHDTHRAVVTALKRLAAQGMQGCPPPGETLVAPQKRPVRLETFASAL